MTHPFIEAALKYRRAQAEVLHEADAFEAAGGKDPEKLLEAVRKMKEAKSAYMAEKEREMNEAEL